MIVPNYIPEPLEVPGNVTEQPYLARVRFIRRTTLLYLGSVLAVGALCLIDLPAIGLVPAILILLGVLTALELWRIATRGNPLEGKISVFMLPIVLTSVALLANEIQLAGWPTWQALIAPACAAIYTVFAGRDYSFMGNFLLSLIFSSIVVAGVATSLDMSVPMSAFALATNLLLLSYFLYDLASLLSRRRLGEEAAAVVDLYRDVL